MPALDPRLWPWWITGLFVLMAAEGIIAIAAHVRGSRSIRLAVASGIVNLLIAVPAVWLLWTGSLVNPEVLSKLSDLAGPAVFGPRGVVPIIIGFVIIGIAVWDTIDGFRKVRRRG